MGPIIVLGGAGGVGRVAVEALSRIDGVEEVVVADLHADAATEIVDTLGDDRLRASPVDVADVDALLALLAGADVVLNCVGPCYRFGPSVLAGAIRAGVGYVDVCDDLDGTRALLNLDAVARDAGVSALIGMGNSPGLANVFVKLCGEQLLDQVTSAEIMHIHGGEPFEGAAVLEHRIHAMVNDVPVFTDGAFTSVRMLEDSGAALVHEEDFAGLGRYPVFPYPHPETITLPTAFPSLQRVVNLGVVYPLPYFELTQELVRAGLAGEEPLQIGETEVAPISVMVALLQRERPRLLAQAGVSGPGGCLRVVVGGVKDGEEHVFICSLTSGGAGAGEGTGIPAALGAALHQRGALGGGPGVHPPEAIVPVAEFLHLAGEVVRRMGIGNGGGIPLTIEHIGPDASREIIPMTLGRPAASDI